MTLNLDPNKKIDEIGIDYIYLLNILNNWPFYLSFSEFILIKWFKAKKKII